MMTVEKTEVEAILNIPDDGLPDRWHSIRLDELKAICNFALSMLRGIEVWCDVTPEGKACNMDYSPAALPLEEDEMAAGWTIQRYRLVKEG